MIKRRVKDSQVQSVLLNNEVLKTVFIAPWYNTLYRGVTDYQSWKDRNPILDDYIYIFGDVEHENFSELDKILPPRLIKSIENLVTMS